MQADAGPAPSTNRKTIWRSVWLIGGTLMLTVSLLLLPRDLLSSLGGYGYLGVFVLTLCASASIVLPSPALGVAALAGSTLNPWLVGLIGGVAAGLGETTGYLAGLGGSPLVVGSRFYPHVERWVRRWGMLTILVLAFVPGPGLDLAGIAAGTLGMRFYRFMLPCLAGKIVRFVIVAWLGHWFIT